MMATLEPIFVNQCHQDCTSGIEKTRPAFTMGPGNILGQPGGIPEI
jgi:hypothetical protein